MEFILGLASCLSYPSTGTASVQFVLLTLYYFLGVLLCLVACSCLICRDPRNVLKKLRLTHDHGSLSRNYMASFK